MRLRTVLQPDEVLYAYVRAWFPMWVHEEGGIAWFHPDPRAIIPLDALHLSRSMRKTLRQGRFTVEWNRQFASVMQGCADRPEGTWIAGTVIDAYTALAEAGYAHSVEVMRDGRLAGGLYGVAIGGAFMAESMFHRETDASKVALAALVERLNDCAFQLLDVQYLTPHLISMGAVEISAAEYGRRLGRAIRARPLPLPAGA